MVWPALPPQQLRSELGEILEAARHQMPRAFDAPDQSIHYANVLVTLDRFVEGLFRASVAPSRSMFPVLAQQVMHNAPHVVHGVDMSRVLALHRIRNKAQHEGATGSSSDAAELMGIAEKLFINAFVVHPAEQVLPQTAQRFISIVERIRLIARQWCEANNFVGAMGYSGEYLYIIQRDARYERVIEGMSSIRRGVAREDKIRDLMELTEDILKTIAGSNVSSPEGCGA
jgi:hypothetical protein